MAITGTETKPEIKTHIPGPEAKKVVKKDDRFLVTTTKTAPVTAREARGVVVEDLDGNTLLDFAAGIGVLNVGHCHPRVVSAIQQQAAKLMHFAGTDFYYPAQADLAERLAQIVPVAGKDPKTFYTNSGTESNEAAIKIAKKATGRHRFLSFLGAFHGRTMGSLALTGSKYIQKSGFFPAMPGVTHVPFPHPTRNIWGINGKDEPSELAHRAIEHIEDIFGWVLPPKDVAALFWEPVQGEGGYVVPPMEFPKLLRELCDEHGILLVADEVQTGFGRTGKMFASEHFDVEPDIMSLAKAMGSGMPIGATVVRSDLDFDEQGSHSNTYGGNVLACTASMATLDVMEEERLVENAARMGDVMGARLDEFVDEHERVIDHRGLGLMRAIELGDKKGGYDHKLRDRLEEALWKRGLMTLGCGKSSLRFIPPLNVNEDQIHGAMDVVAEGLKAVKA